MTRNKGVVVVVISHFGAFPFDPEAQAPRKQQRKAIKMPTPLAKGTKTFHSDWAVKYGLEVSTRDPSSSEISCVMCMFLCREFGRDDEGHHYDAAGVEVGGK